MSSDSEDDDPDNLPQGGSKQAGLDWAEYNGDMGMAFFAGSPVAGLVLSRHQNNRKRPAAPLFTTHICHSSLENYLSTMQSLAADMLRRRRVTAVGAYINCTRLKLPDEGIIKRSIDLLFLCPACVNEMITLTAANSEALEKLVVGGFRRPSSAHMFIKAFEVVLRNAPRGGCLQCSNGGLVDFPCVDLGLCRCTMRPLYVAIYFSNVHMMGILLRYGADVRAEDSCPCDDQKSVHPLVQVYKSLACGNYGIPARLTRDMPYSEDFVRCHQLAILLMPTDDSDLREACYAFTCTFMSDLEFEAPVLEKGTLQHMCRVAVRSVLARSQALPSGVEQLPLPKHLQDYLLYQDRL